MLTARCSPGCSLLTLRMSLRSGLGGHDAGKTPGLQGMRNEGRDRHRERGQSPRPVRVEGVWSRWTRCFCAGLSPNLSTRIRRTGIGLARDFPLSKATQRMQTPPVQLTTTCEIRSSFCLRRNMEVLFSTSDAPSPAQTLYTEPSNCRVAPPYSLSLSALPALPPKPLRILGERVLDIIVNMRYWWQLPALYRLQTIITKAACCRGRKPDSEFSSDVVSLALRVLSLNPKCT